MSRNHLFEDALLFVGEDLLRFSVPGIALFVCPDERPPLGDDLCDGDLKACCSGIRLAVSNVRRARPLAS